MQSRLYDAAAGSKRTRLAALSRHDPRDLYTTVFWSKHSRTILICWHAAVLALVIFTIAFELAGPDSLAPGWYGGTFFAYLTNWTWWLLGARALLGIAVCITGGSDTTKADAAPRYTLLDKFFAVLTAVLPTATVIVAVGYWAAVRGSIGEVYLDEPIKHGVNAVIMLAEVMLTRLPVTTTWVVFPVLYLAVYTIFQVIYWAGSEDWVYERTDFRNCVILPGYFLLPIVAVGVFFAMCAPLQACAWNLHCHWPPATLHAVPCCSSCTCLSWSASTCMHIESSSAWRFAHQAVPSSRAEIRVQIRPRQVAQQVVRFDENAVELARWRALRRRATKHWANKRESHADASTESRFCCVDSLAPAPCGRHRHRGVVRRR